MLQNELAWLPLLAQCCMLLPTLLMCLAQCGAFNHSMGKVLKIGDGPYYPDIQREVDCLVALGLVNIQNFHYIERPDGGARIDGLYGLRFNSEQLFPILNSLGTSSGEDAFDPRDRRTHRFLVELAGALATLPDDEIDVASTVDATYANELIGDSNIVDFESSLKEGSSANRV